MDLLRESQENVKQEHKLIQQVVEKPEMKSCGHHGHHHHDNHHHHHHHHHHSEDNLKSRITSKDITNRPRQSAYPMISVEQAVAIILANSDTQATEEIPFMDSLNRVCAADIVARDPLPPFAASVKDGFAVRLTQEQKNYIRDKQNNKNVKWIFKVVGASNAGDSVINMELNEGECLKINTGAPVPLKADVVVQIEDTRALEKDWSTEIDTVIEIVGTSGCGGGDNHGHIDIKLGQDIRY